MSDCWCWTLYRRRPKDKEGVNSPSVTLHRRRRRESGTTTHHLWHDTDAEKERVALQLTICDTTKKKKKREWHYNSPSVTWHRCRKRKSSTTTHHLWRYTEGEEERVALELTICWARTKPKSLSSSPTPAVIASPASGPLWNLRLICHSTWMNQSTVFLHAEPKAVQAVLNSLLPLPESCTVSSTQQSVTYSRKLYSKQYSTVLPLPYTCTVSSTQQSVTSSRKLYSKQYSTVCYLFQKAVQ